ncbi:hypothetical protein D9M68_665240 [compost metagenome]
MGAGHGFDLDFVFMHHHDRALGLLPHHVARAQRPDRAFGRLDEEGAARVGGDRNGNGAIQQADLPVGGREVEIDTAAGIQQQLATVGQDVAAAFARGGGGVRRNVAQGVERIAHVGCAGAGTGERQRAGQETAARRRDGLGRSRLRLGGGAGGGVPGGVCVAKPAERRPFQ